jgi:[acyl-carrier-protein] S-malonyltransferase
MFEGDPEELQLTENAQPALMAVSVAALRVLLERADRRLGDLAVCVAGHSLGEYSALAATGALRVADAARLLKLRGRAMQRAVPVGVGAMAALIGLDFEDAQKVALAAGQGEVCAAANDNAPGQVVVSGHRGAVERAVALAAEQGARRSIILPVSAPFHCPLMGPAAEVMAEALDAVNIWEPEVPVIANVTARPVTDPADIRSLLVRQVTSDVRWRESILFMKDQGVNMVVELGVGKVLAGLVRRTDRHIKTASLHTIEEIEGHLPLLT